MTYPISIVGPGGILLGVAAISAAILLLLFVRNRRTQDELETQFGKNIEGLKKNSAMLKNLSDRADGLEKEFHRKEDEQVLREIRKISKLWKSRRERLKMGLWRRIEAEPKELKKLKDKEAGIEKLIEKAKAKYHKRELDEESFREIVSGYQKELMELSLEIKELERQ